VSPHHVVEKVFQVSPFCLWIISVFDQLTSLDELVEATTVPKDRLCRACFDGVYPIVVPDNMRRPATLLDAPLMLSSGGGAGDSLSRP
jgi:hypothetical protein